MKTLKQRLESNPRKLATVAPDQTIYEALKVMAESDVGALLVMEGHNLRGVFSERDYARKVILNGKSSFDTNVSEAMSGRVAYVTLDRTVEECLAIMTEKHFRHLPVLNDSGNVVGIISIGDLIKEVINQQQFIIKQLENYISS